VGLVVIEHLRIIITRVVAVGLIALLSVSASALAETAPLVGNALFLLGVVLVAIATLGRLWCSLFIAGYKTATLITVGPYSMCRNPLYFFSLLGAVGVALTTETLLIPAIILMAFAIYYPLVIKSEEAQLLKLHGSAFRDYQEAVPRFFPALSGLVEPRDYTVKPRVFRKHMADVIWFFILVGFLKVNQALHALEMLPTLFRIY
jgi:protein-S-isoprenylcysteine O-methyltransferase Ste14